MSSAPLGEEPRRWAANDRMPIATPMPIFVLTPALRDRPASEAGFVVEVKEADGAWAWAWAMKRAIELGSDVSEDDKLATLREAMRILAGEGMVLMALKKRSSGADAWFFGLEQSQLPSCVKRRLVGATRHGA